MRFDDEERFFRSGGALLEFVDGGGDFVQGGVGADRKVGSRNVVRNGRRNQANRQAERREFLPRGLQAGETAEPLETADDQNPANVVLRDALSDRRLNRLLRRQVASANGGEKEEEEEQEGEEDEEEEEEERKRRRRWRSKRKRGVKLKGAQLGMCILITSTN